VGNNVIVNYTNPVKLKPARAWRTYIGGSRLDLLHGSSHQCSGHYPEEWIMSTVSARNAGQEKLGEEGLSFLENSDLSLLSLLNLKGTELLGECHVRKFGNQTGVLVKLIDSNERLSVQVHPDRKSAKRLFNSKFGKTECWHILDGGLSESKPYIYL
jgi:mannose-6-phosphate isomerase